MLILPVVDAASLQEKPSENSFTTNVQKKLNTETRKKVIRDIGNVREALGKRKYTNLNLNIEIFHKKGSQDSQDILRYILQYYMNLRGAFLLRQLGS